MQDNTSSLTDDAGEEIVMPDTVVEFLKLLYDSRNQAKQEGNRFGADAGDGEDRANTPQYGAVSGQPEELLMLTEQSQSEDDDY